MVTLLLVLSAFLGCEARDPCPDGSMLDGDEGLILTEAEHGEAWGQADCFACHARSVLHRTGCSPDVDLERIQDLVEVHGLLTCAGCHGDNGATP